MGNDKKRTLWHIRSQSEPTVWGIGDVTYELEYHIYDADNRYVFTCGRGESGEGLAAYIVQVHNTYDALVTTLQSCLDWLTSAPIDYHNDVVHSGMDEGNILGWQGHWELQTKIEAAIALTTEATNENNL